MYGRKHDRCRAHRKQVTTSHGFRIAGGPPASIAKKPSEMKIANGDPRPPTSGVNVAEAPNS
jgi:hypothetical protein